MRYGLTIFPTDYTLQPDELARGAEERGFESLWFPEHSHIPVSRRSPWPGGPVLPKEYSHTYDPFVALTVAAAVTRDLKLATGVCLIIERDPITTAKEIASLDRLSGGRFIFGIGGGWNAEEMEDHGTVFKTRFRRLNESIAAMQALWTQDEPEYHGCLVNFDKTWFNPRPLQQPYPPIHMGGFGATTWDRVVAFGDGWVPNARDANAELLKQRIPERKRRFEEAGRDPDKLEITLYNAPVDADAVTALEAAGVDRVVFSLACREPEAVRGDLDRYAALVR
jgi:probable F420-dependent oxidoreductase